MRRSNRVQLKQDKVENVAPVKLSKTLKAKKNTTKLKERMQAASVDWTNNRFSTLKECAEYHGVKYKSLHAGIVARGGEF